MGAHGFPSSLTPIGIAENRRGLPGQFDEIGAVGDS